MMQVLETYELVQVEWIDSRQASPAWRFIKDLEEIKPVTCISIGWPVKETEEILYLAQSMGDLDYEMQVSGVLTIPVVCIKSKRKITFNLE